MRHEKFKRFERNMREFEHYEKNNTKAKALAGILAICFGILVLLYQMDMGVHHAFASWSFALVLIGFVSLVKHNFRKLWGLVLMGVGGVFMLKEFYPGLIETKLIWPVLIIIIGIGVFIKALGSKSRSARYTILSEVDLSNAQGDDYFESTAFFGGVNKKVVSKNFKGANISSIFGGTELDLSNADFEKQATIAITCAFGGVNIIVPSNWKVKSDISTAFGGVDDKRQVSLVDDNGKLLILTGSCFFGGVEVSGHV